MRGAPGSEWEEIDEAQTGAGAAARSAPPSTGERRGRRDAGSPRGHGSAISTRATCRVGFPSWGPTDRDEGSTAGLEAAAERSVAGHVGSVEAAERPVAGPVGSVAAAERPVAGPVGSVAGHVGSVAAAERPVEGHVGPVAGHLGSVRPHAGSVVAAERSVEGHWTSDRGVWYTDLNLSFGIVSSSRG